MFNELGTQHFKLHLNKETKAITIQFGTYAPVLFDEDYLNELHELIKNAQVLFYHNQKSNFEIGEKLKSYQDYQTNVTQSGIYSGSVNPYDRN